MMTPPRFLTSRDKMVIARDLLSDPALIPGRGCLYATNLEVSIGARQKTALHWKSRKAGGGKVSGSAPG